MDVSNERLKHLLARTDEAFQALLKEPDSIALNEAYETAKAELDEYISSLREALSKKRLKR
ncbi:hypothetical protein IT774_03060 [Salinimonas marina]|uniref:Uncharacterized protein n=1 Tax=Salinimonas marina TaxID=2785918 RepID=A0A7S9DY90_9ALTE|nr:hypothetical protein [Salinimonas marina]QPG06207.1 hypothetical protein IT774_03060 [Salinimonas marina]